MDFIGISSYNFIVNQNQELIFQILKALVDIIKENQAYSLWILKQIEKNLPLFIDII